MSKMFRLIFTIVVIFFLAPPAWAGPFADGLKSAAGAMGYPETTDKSPLTLARKAGAVFAVGLLGAVFLILMIYGGFIWMLGRGEEKEITRAKMLIKNAIIGLIIVLAAYAITVFISVLFQ